MYKIKFVHLADLQTITTFIFLCFIIFANMLDRKMLILNKPHYTILILTKCTLLFVRVKEHINPIFVSSQKMYIDLCLNRKNVLIMSIKY